ncbi:hypothetical protein ACH5RR_035388 [Cinchona calisaya]|uniref:Reverse transcriptase n=1 Tax=Cinchona calisaya TaxID=153742 RepID=A0ABD2Y015_9GENT
MLKSIALAMPSYVMSCFKIPKKLCEELSAKMMTFWWGGSDQERKIQWMKWAKLSEVKREGGLGFRDIQCFNLALLVKQVWRIITKQNHLVSKVLKSKYFPSESI